MADICSAEDIVEASSTAASPMFLCRCFSANIFIAEASLSTSALCIFRRNFFVVNFFAEASSIPPHLPKLLNQHLLRRGFCGHLLRRHLLRPSPKLLRRQPLHRNMYHHVSVDIVFAEASSSALAAARVRQSGSTDQNSSS